MGRPSRYAFILVLGLVAAPAVTAQEAKMDTDIMSEGFLAAHPDLRWRIEGARSYEGKQYDRALTEFQRAARHADKPSQAIIAEMYWSGTGVGVDRALAYAWMDLAAERHYFDFLVRREGMWESLDEHQRADAVTRGQALWAEYGDDVAKPRLAKILRRERKVTGSRTGYVGGLSILPFTGPLAGKNIYISGDRYYAAKYWQPEKYWELQDAIWKAPLKGRVQVGDLENVPAAPTKPQDGKDR